MSERSEQAAALTAPSRSARVVAFRLANPCLTLADISQRFGVTGERVRQILAKAGVATKAWRPPPDRYECWQCHCSFVPSKMVRRTSARTGKEILYCGMPCQVVANTVTLTCHQCGASFPRQLTVVRRNRLDPRYKGHDFCKRSCQWRWYGLTYGVGSPGSTARAAWEAKYANRTHCRHGHLWIPANLVRYPSSPYYACRLCAADSNQRKRARKLLDTSGSVP